MADSDARDAEVSYRGLTIALAYHLRGPQEGHSGWSAEWTDADGVERETPIRFYSNGEAALAAARTAIDADLDRGPHLAELEAPAAAKALVLEGALTCDFWHGRSVLVMRGGDLAEALAERLEKPREANGSRDYGRFRITLEPVRE